MVRLLFKLLSRKVFYCVFIAVFSFQAVVVASEPQPVKLSFKVKCGIALTAIAGTVGMGAMMLVPTGLLERSTRAFYSDFRGQSPLEYGRLSRLWAQEYVGMSYVHQRIEEEKIEAKIRVGLVDNHDFELRLLPQIPLAKDGLFHWSQHLGAPMHGDHIAHLIADPDVGAGPLTVISALLRVSPRNVPEGGDYKEALGYAVYQAGKTRAALVGVSIGPSTMGGFTAGDVKWINQAADEGHILIKSAGNSWGRLLPFNSSPLEWPDELRAIGVGSLDADGLVSSFSVEHAKVVIYAPAGLIQQSQAGNDFIDFGGTSGAQPLVLGALGNALALIQENPHYWREGVSPLTFNEVKSLLLATALWLRQDDGRYVPMINAARLMEVGLRIRDQVNLDRTDILRAESKLYQFQSKAQDLLAKGLGMMGSANLEAQLKGEELVRASLLLHPTAAARQELVRFYESKGLNINAQFYSRVTVEDRP